MTKQKGLSWKKVEEYLRENTKAGAAMALVETEKILAQVFAELSYPGKNTDANVRLAKPIIGNYKDLEMTRQVTKKVTQETDCEIKTKEAEQLLEAYYQSIGDIMKQKKFGKSFWNRIKFYFFFLEKLANQSWKKILISVLVFFFIVWLLNRTAPGLWLVDVVVIISNFIFSWLILTALLIVSILVIVIGSIFYFENRKKKDKKGKDRIRVED